MYAREKTENISRFDSAKHLRLKLRAQRFKQRINWKATKKNKYINLTNSDAFTCEPAFGTSMQVLSQWNASVILNHLGMLKLWKSN